MLGWAESTEAHTLNSQGPIPNPCNSSPQDDPMHSTILASVLISARTQSGQSRSPQNRNLCKEVRQVVRLEGVRCGQCLSHYCSSGSRWISPIIRLSESPSLTHLPQTLF